MSGNDAKKQKKAYTSFNKLGVFESETEWFIVLYLDANQAAKQIKHNSDRQETALPENQ